MSKPSAIVFFPWVRIIDPIGIGRLRLIPYERRRSPKHACKVPQNVIDRILKAYADPPDRVVTFATLVELDKWRTGDSDESLPGDLWQLRDCIAMAALSKRSLFRGHHEYLNFDTFQMVVQRFTEDSAGSFAFTTRRRDGGTSQVWDTESFIWRRPPHVPSQTTLRESAVTLAVALLGEVGKDSSLAESVKEFVRANTDSLDVPVHVEVVMQKSAFEWFFGIDEKVPSFRAALKAAVGPLIAADTLPKQITSFWHKRYPKSPRPLDAWAGEFCDLRGQAAHGHKKDVRASRFLWTPEAHLAFASVLFPTLVRKRLANAGVIDERPSDRARLANIERLLIPKPMKHSQSKTHPWSRFETACIEADLHAAIERALDDDSAESRA